jgi:hypothetical protein
MAVAAGAVVVMLVVVVYTKAYTVTFRRQGPDSSCVTFDARQTLRYSDILDE